MFRKYVIVTLAMMLCLYGTTACTSKKAEGDDAEMAAADGGDEALEEADATENNSDLDADAGSGETAVAEAAPPAGGDDLGGEVDELAGGGDEQAAVADSGGGEVTPNELEAAPADMAADAPPPDTSGDVAASEPTPDPEVAAPPSPVASEPPPIQEPGAMDSGSETPVAATGGLRKVNWTPYKVGKTLVNAIYIAREGDTVESISKKVGVSEKDICKVNSFNCGRATKVGDKYYYNSPQRPTDETTVKTFYEDAGLQPETYTAKAGDNIRKVGKELLGHDRSWMELYSLNEVESKGDLDEGTALKYWPKTDVAAPALAQTDQPAPAEAPSAEAPPPPPADAMAPPPPDQAANDLPPGPDPNAVGSVEPPPPPPPPPPPTEAAPPADQQMAGMDSTMAQDPDQTMMLGVGAVLLLAAAALFISIRKKRARRQIDFNTTTQTQIE